MKPSPMIDPKKFQVDVLALITENAAIGLTVDEASSLLTGHEQYAAYADEPTYMPEWTKSMLEKLAGQGLVVLKGDRYFPGTPAVTE